MRPSIDEQLNGAVRLIRLAEDDPEISRDLAELVRNARRLVERVSASWSTAYPFLAADNARCAELLGVQAPSAPDLNEAAAVNEELRHSLTQRIRDGLGPTERARVGAYLRARVDADPT